MPGDSELTKNSRANQPTIANHPVCSSDDRKSLIRSVLIQFSVSDIMKILNKYFCPEQCSPCSKWSEANLRPDKDCNLNQVHGDKCSPSICLDEDPGGHLLLARMQGVAKKLSSVIRAIAELLKMEEDLFKFLDEQYASWKARNKSEASDPALKEPFPPGPVGESPVHIVILKRLKDTGKRILERYYLQNRDSRDSYISVSYLNDLDPWRNARASRLQSQSREDGLYTGETCLHMAIVQEDEELVQYLLDHGIRICSRARGVFFQPAHIRYTIMNYFSEFLSVQRQIKDRYFDLLYGWFRIQLSNRVKRGELAVLHHVQNPRSGCYYGEFPLSFAASIGNVRICEQLLNRHLQVLKNPKKLEISEDVQEQIYQLDFLNKRLKYIRGLHSDHQLRITPELKKVLFLNAMDTFGNTAMHMAVMHEKKDVIDWLMGQESAKQSLETLNNEGLTPLTLAARLGRVGVYNHILREHLSVVVWKYGKVRD